MFGVNIKDKDIQIYISKFNSLNLRIDTCKNVNNPEAIVLV